MHDIKKWFELKCMWWKLNQQVNYGQIWCEKLIWTRCIKIVKIKENFQRNREVHNWKQV